MKPADVQLVHNLSMVLSIVTKTQNLKMVIILNIKIKKKKKKKKLAQKYPPFWSEELFVIKKLGNTVQWT